jgi:hypothetical protein
MAEHQADRDPRRRRGRGVTDDRRADLLRAFQVLAPALNDDATRDAIAALLGLEWIGQTAVPASPVVPSIAVSALEPIKLSATATAVSAPSPPVERLPTATPEPFHLRRHRGADRRPPAWMEEAAPLPRLDTTAAAVPLAVDPLIDPLQARAILSSALARHVAGGPLDVERVVEQVARGEAILDLPRQRPPSIARGVQLLLDRGGAMAPHVADQAWLTDAMRKVVGGYALDVLEFADSPLRAAGKGRRRMWKPYMQLMPPRSGATVVAVTDLGIRALPPPASPSTQDEWVAFADYLDRFGCPLIALVPYSRERCPRRLRRRFAILTWDRRTTAAAARAALARGLP